MRSSWGGFDWGLGVDGTGWRVASTAIHIIKYNRYRKWTNKNYRPTFPPSGRGLESRASSLSTLHSSLHLPEAEKSLIFSFVWKTEDKYISSYKSNLVLLCHFKNENIEIMTPPARLQSDSTRICYKNTSRSILILLINFWKLKHRKHRNNDSFLAILNKNIL